MKPFSIYYKFSEGFLAIQKKLADIICNAVEADMVFLIGASLNRRRTESIFNPTAPSTQFISDCFLVVVVNDNTTRSLPEVQDLLETRCRGSRYGVPDRRFTKPQAHGKYI